MQIQGKENGRLSTLTKRNNQNMQRVFKWNSQGLLRANEARKAGICNLEEESYPAKWRPGRECTDSGPKGPRGRRWRLTSLVCGQLQPPASRRGEGRAQRPTEPRPKLYLHNASTFSLGVTCEAIRSRPLRRRSWCALLGLLPPGQWRSGRARSRHSRRLSAAQQ